MSETVTLTYEVLKDDYVNGGKASSEIKKILRQLGINQSLIRKIAISSYEAEMNLVIHSLGGEITCEIGEDCIILQTIDQGPGIKDIEKAMTPGYSTANEIAREMGFGAGMGLPNMLKNSDEFVIKSSEKGTSIKMTYHIG